VSFRGRLALLTSFAVAVTSVAGAGAVYLIVRDRLHDAVTGQLRTRAGIHAARGFANITQLRPLEGPRIPEPTTLPRLISADGRVLAARYPRLSYPLTAEARAVAAGSRRSSLSDLHFGAQHLKVLTVPAGRGRALQLAQSLESVDDTVDTLAVVLASAAGAVVLIALLAGQLVATGALRPVRRLKRMAEEIASTGDLAQRIEVRGHDELASLAASFNTMLARLAAMVEALERARRSQRQLVADASHELRTPLTTLRANVELLALGENAAVGSREDLVSDILGELDGLTALVGDLIDLAREDQREPERTPVRLDEIVEDALARVRHHYPAVDFDVRLEPTMVLGSDEALSRAVANLLDNAGKWSPDGGLVEVILRDGALQVRDHGLGIEDADLPHVFERFYRGVGARVRPGSGLGLAIVAQVVSAHGGEVRAERAPGGGALLTAGFPRTRALDS
jgi:two-component system sensor histidine kinase MprB